MASTLPFKRGRRDVSSLTVYPSDYADYRLSLVSPLSPKGYTGVARDPKPLIHMHGHLSSSCMPGQGHRAAVSGILLAQICLAMTFTIRHKAQIFHNVSPDDPTWEDRSND
jgi:hypothetical protein